MNWAAFTGFVVIGVIVVLLWVMVDEWNADRRAHNASMGRDPDDDGEGK